MKVPGSRKTMFLPSIRDILDKYEATSRMQQPSICKLRVGTLRYFIIAVPVDTARCLVKQLHCRSEARLQDVWIEAGVLTEPADAVPDATRKLSFQALNASLGTFCVTAVAEHGGTRSSCWSACRHGHCPHEYAAQQVAEIPTHVKQEVPNAREGAQALRLQERQRLQPPAGGRGPHSACQI
jgi:hypothetical protein